MGIHTGKLKLISGEHERREKTSMPQDVASNPLWVFESNYDNCERRFDIMKKIITVLICFILVISFTPLVYAGEIPPTPEAPLNLSAHYDTSMGMIIRWAEPESITKLYRPGPDKILDEVFAEIDLKINDGSWRLEGKTWDQNSDAWGQGPLLVAAYQMRHDANNVMDTFITSNNLGDNFSLENNTYYFRVRYVLKYAKDNHNEYAVGPYSEVVSVGKKVTAKLPASLEAPAEPKAELMKDLNGAPYFALSWDTPDSIMQANQLVRICAFADWRMNDGKWASESGQLPFSTGSQLDDHIDIRPLDSGGIGEIDIKANLYTFRVYFKYEFNGNTIVSQYSTPISIGTPAYSYKGASTWAVPELNKASEYGFITDRIRGNISGPITREEFCEVVVRLYEKATGKQAAYKDNSVFSDTKNPEIFKAYELGIVKGVGGNKFAPEQLITREQIAAMMHRAVKAIKPGADFSTAGANAYPDENDISGYALESVNFMSKNGLMTNISGNFVPNGTTTREQAVVIAVRTVERYGN